MVRVAVDFDLALEKPTSFDDAELQLTFRAEFFNISTTRNSRTRPLAGSRRFSRDRSRVFETNHDSNVMTGHF